MRNIFFGLITMILIVIVGCVSSDNQSNTTEEIPSPPPPAKVTGDLKLSLIHISEPTRPY